MSSLLLLNPNAPFITALILLPAVVLVIWAWSVKADVEEELGSFSGFEGMHLEIGPQATESTEGAR